MSHIQSHPTPQHIRADPHLHSDGAHEYMSLYTCTHTPIYTHLPALVTRANTHSRTHKCKFLCACPALTHGRPPCTDLASAPSHLFIYVEPHCPPPTLIHLLSLGKVLRLLTASTTLFLCEFIHIFTQQALSTHYMSGTVPGSGDQALLLASCWWGQSGRDGERLREMERSVSMALFLWEAYPVPIITICLSLRS